MRPVYPTRSTLAVISVSETPTELPLASAWCGGACGGSSPHEPLSVDQLQVALASSCCCCTARTAPTRHQQQQGRQERSRPWRGHACSVLSLAAALTAVHVVDAGGAAAPAPTVDCTDALVSLAGCLTYVEEGSNATTPDPSCCSGLKDVVRKEVACLCQAFQSGRDYGVTLNFTKALQLPAACKVKTPPFSKCHISVPGVTGGAPAPAPSSGAPFFGQSPSSTSPAASQAGTGVESTSPAPSPSRSDAVSFSAPAQTFAAVTIVGTLLAHGVL